MHNIYNLLGVAENATLEEIKKAIYDRTRKWTRQSSSAPKVEMRRQAEDNLRLLGEAEKYFADEQSRARYDSLLSEQKKRDQEEREAYSRHAREAGGRSDIPNLEEQIEKAWRFFEDGNIEAAAQIAFAVRLHAPNNNKILKIVVAGYLDAENDDAALLTASEAALTYPNDPEIQFLLGSVFKRRQEWQKAFRAFEKAFKLDNGMNTEYVIELVDAALGCQNNDLVITLLEPLLNSGSNPEVVLYYLGLAYLNKAGEFLTIIPEGYHVPAGYYYTHRDQIALSKQYIAKAKALNYAGLASYIADRERDVSAGESRRFMGSIGSLRLAVIAGVILLFLQDVSALGFYFLMSALFYYISSLTKSYVINRRVLEGKNDATMDNLMSGSGCMGMVIILVIMPVFALGNFVKNYLSME